MVNEAFTPTADVWREPSEPARFQALGWKFFRRDHSMRGNVLAALAAAAIIALLSIWRISDRSGDDLVDVSRLPGSWARTAMESCNPHLPERITFAQDGGYEADGGAGVLNRDESGRYSLIPANADHPYRVFRADAERLELLNQLGCKATYSRAE